MQQDLPLSDVIVYRSEVVVNLAPGAIKMVQLPAEANDVPMGLHGPIAAYYQLSGSAFIPHATTLDYVVGAIVACLTGSCHVLSAKGRSPQHAAV